MHIMSISCSTTNAVSSVCCPILFKVLTLNITICTVLLHLSNFFFFFLDFTLSSVAGFSNTGARAPASAEHTSFFTCAKGNPVWTYGLSKSHGDISMALFFISSIDTSLINE